jgi:polysaccharide export outer membrane protein
MLRSAAIILFLAGVCYGTQEDKPRQNRPQTEPAQANQPAPARKVLVSPEEDYRIGPGDVLEINIEDAPELGRVFQVTAAGTFNMSYLGRIKAQGKTTEELANLIADGLRGRYLKDPKVTVIVREYNSRSFFIQGAVRNPNVYQIEGRPTLLELLTLAGGLTNNHGSLALIIRKLKVEQVEATDDNATAQKTDEVPKFELKKVNISGLLKGQFDQNVFLEPGDIVHIPETEVFFVAGEVNAPGPFPLKEGTTLRQAISLAQGTKPQAALGDGIIFREDSTGKRQEIRVDIGAIMKGKKEDIPIAANDIIIVPNSRTKSVGFALLRAFGITAVTRLPY